MSAEPTDAPRVVAGILLAAGAATRMGRTKQLLPVDGVPMVRRAAEVMRAAGCAPLVVVTGHDADAVEAALDGLDVHCVRVADPTAPTSASLHAGLRALGAEVASTVVLLADMVHVTAPMVAALVRADVSGTAPLQVSRYGDVPAPPLLFRRALWPELLAWTGEGCGKAVVRAHASEAGVHDWPVEALRDIDTPEDYAALSH
jgi:CTP:molybdopterin cytidylyltransferase MocA